MFSFHSACRRSPLRRLNGSGTRLFAVSLCCLVVAALSGCGYVVNGSTAGALHVSPGAITFGAVPVGQTAVSSVTLLNRVLHRSTFPVKCRWAELFFEESGQSSRYCRRRFDLQFRHRLQARKRIQLLWPIHRDECRRHANCSRPNQWIGNEWQWQQFHAGIDSQPG